MSLLRATVRNSDKWWVAHLLDLNIVAEGATESEMLRDVEHSLIAEYHLALKFGKTPFVNLLLGCPVDRSDAWNGGDKKFRGLNLPAEVSQALAAVFRIPDRTEFKMNVAA